MKKTLAALAVLVSVSTGIAMASELTIQDKAAVDAWTDLTYGQAKSPNDPMGDTGLLQSLTKEELLGATTFRQHCNACHAGEASIAVTYGPRVTKDNLVDREDFIRMQITEGSPNMPAFKYALKPRDVDRIMAYLRKVPSPCYDCKVGDFRRAIPVSQ
jgi:mono/diheme cytochrome c family protein